MKIEDFGASMEHYKLLEGSIGSQESINVNELNYIRLRAAEINQAYAEIEKEMGME